MPRPAGLSARLKLALSYAGFVMLAVTLLLVVVWLFLLRYVPSQSVAGPEGFTPGRDDLIRAFAPAATWAFILLLLFAVIGGWILAGRMLAPLQRITAATRAAANGSLSHRIQLEGSDDEFRELADSFDTMLARLESHVAEQQRFAANASHELRTPLAIMQTLIDVAQQGSDRDHDADLARLKSTNTRAIETTEALLLLSRAANTLAEREPVDLSLLAEQAAETLLPLAERHDVRIDVDGPMCAAQGSPALLLQLVTNLVHNAIIHNLPKGGIVRVTTQQAVDSVALTVENTGIEVAPERIALLTEPFFRASDRTRADGHTGTGLGLSIVERIVWAHDGILTIASRDGGGLRVRVELPRHDV